MAMKLELSNQLTELVNEYNAKRWGDHTIPALVIDLKERFVQIMLCKDHLLSQEARIAKADVSSATSIELTLARIMVVSTCLLKEHTAESDGYVTASAVNAPAAYATGSIAATTSVSKIANTDSLVRKVEALTRYGINPAIRSAWKTISEMEDGDYVRLEDVLAILGGKQ